MPRPRAACTAYPRTALAPPVSARISFSTRPRLPLALTYSQATAEPGIVFPASVGCKAGSPLSAGRSSREEGPQQTQDLVYRKRPAPEGKRLKRHSEHGPVSSAFTLLGNCRQPETCGTCGTPRSLGRLDRSSRLTRSRS